MWKLCHKTEQWQLRYLPFSGLLLLPLLSGWRSGFAMGPSRSLRAGDRCLRRVGQPTARCGGSSIWLCKFAALGAFVSCSVSLLSVGPVQWFLHFDYPGPRVMFLHRCSVLFVKSPERLRSLRACVVLVGPSCACGVKKITNTILR